jgi:hypothetical protein
MNDSGQPVPIIVASVGPDTYRVNVQAKANSEHRVTVSPAYLKELDVAAQPVTRVIEESFRFLLERESNTSILAGFDLREIERYFPEFPAEIARRLKS